MEADTQSNTLKPMKIRFIEFSLLLADLAVFLGLFGGAGENRALRDFTTLTNFRLKI